MRESGCHVTGLNVNLRAGESRLRGGFKTQFFSERGPRFSYLVASGRKAKILRSFGASSAGRT
ncbi:MAG: hypothetical protein DMG16_19140 [Acidobacteria bacterium]|nr:MAG: hypothetical protein DMG16_19140 [Acidobacteriota bacterium]